jgi:CBS domain-containing protein
MSPRELSESVVREASLLTAEEPTGDAVRKVIDSGLPALPVVDGGKLVGIFGEREFITALFPGYLKELNYAGFVPHSLDRALEKRQSCRAEPVSQHMNTEHVEVEGDYSDAQLAENFLHHRVLIVPVVTEGRVTGVITRADFFRVLAERFLEKGEA